MRDNEFKCDDDDYGDKARTQPKVYSSLLVELEIVELVRDSYENAFHFKKTNRKTTQANCHVSKRQLAVVNDK